MKTLSLLKACFTQDMNMFKYSAKKESSKLTKKLFPILLFMLVGISIGTYAYVIAKELYPYHLTYIMLSMFIFIVTIITFMEGIYKSQGILFEARDNDLLFSLPIKKSQILLVRIIKLLAFQFIYNLMFILPAFVIYIYFERPGINFYLISLLMSLLISIIPTIVSSILGYMVKLVSSKFKSKKIMQTLLSSLIFLFIFFVSMNADDFIKNIASKAESINDLLTSIYYPIGAYINLITKFKLLDLIKLLLTSCIGLVANLKYPKMNASNDTEVVKQSMSSMIGVFSGMGILIGSIFLVTYLSDKFSILTLLSAHVTSLFIISIILYLYLIKYGTIEYRKINV